MKTAIDLQGRTIRCPKDLRHGPCGGVDGHLCEVDGYICPWGLSYLKAQANGRLPQVLENYGKIPPEFADWDPAIRARHGEEKSSSHLERVLRAGHFAVTAEISPPKAGSGERMQHHARRLQGIIDAANVTDNQVAIVRMASWAGCVLVQQTGMEAVLQMTVRDRNRLSLQSDLVGAWAVGIKNVLCLSGDYLTFGNHKEAKPVYDIDSTELIRVIKTMRDRGVFMSGDPIESPPRFFIGAAANPSSDAVPQQVLRRRKKVAAGADFIQTQMVYDIAKFRTWMQGVRDLGLDEQVYILVSVGPLKSIPQAKYLASGKVPGLTVPDHILKRLEGVPKKHVREEGIEICVELVDQIRETPGVAGIHVITVLWEEAIPAIVERARLLPRPTVM